MQANTKVLLVEDDGGVRKAIVRVLRGSGYEVQSYKSAEDLQAFVGEGALSDCCQCLVCDIRLPGVSGFELHRRLAEQGTMPAWIFITAHDDPAVRRQAERDGSGYLLKPFRGRALLALVAEAVHAA